MKNEEKTKKIEKSEKYTNIENDRKIDANEINIVNQWQTKEKVNRKSCNNRIAENENFCKKQQKEKMKNDEKKNRSQTSEKKKKNMSTHFSGGLITDSACGAL